MTLVRYESRGHVATITMDRASAHNALNPALCNELCEAWLRFRDSDDRVAVLASAEDAYFSVGADVEGVFRPTCGGRYPDLASNWTSR